MQAQHIDWRMYLNLHVHMSVHKLTSVFVYFILTIAAMHRLFVYSSPQPHHVAIMLWQVMQ